MLFSCKISNSILTYLERKGMDLEFVHEQTEIPMEFVRDPSYWMDAGQMENLLRCAVEKQFQHDIGILETVGHKAGELRAWGVLDSVLRMMSQPLEILAQPERFLSYFINPAPPIGQLVQSADEISFELPVSSEQFPYVTAYLKHAFESLPSYVGKPLASSSWEGSRFSIQWSSSQETFFADSDTDPGHKISPDLLRSIIESLEKNQKELEEKNKVLVEKNEALERAQQNLELQTQDDLPLSTDERTLGQDIKGPLINAMAEVMKLHDYMVRAQQLITLLVAQGRQTREVREAMRRVDWEYVSQQFPESIRYCSENIQQIQGLLEKRPNDSRKGLQVVQ